MDAVWKELQVGLGGWGSQWGGGWHKRWLRRCQRARLPVPRLRVQRAGARTCKGRRGASAAIRRSPWALQEVKALLRVPGGWHSERGGPGGRGKHSEL